MIKMMQNPEVLRRIAALAGLLAAIWLFLWPVEYVYRVNLVDFQAMQQKARWKEDRAKPLDQYIAQEVKDRLIKVSGPQWQTLVDDLLKARGTKEPEALQGRKYTIGPGYTDYYYFGPDQEPLASLGMARDRFTYLMFTVEGGHYFLALSGQPFRWASDAPGWLLHPTRGYSWVPLALGLLAYIFIPRRKAPQGSWAYSRFSAQVMIDVVGLFLTGVFFALPLLIIPGNADIWSVFNFDGGWTILTIVFWGPLAGCGLVLLGYAAWYGSIWLLAGPNGLTRASLRGVESFAYADIQYAEPYERGAPRWLVWGLMLLGQGNPTAMGQALLIQSNVEVGFMLHLKDGRKVRIMFNSMSGAAELPGALDAAGVDVRLEDRD